MDLIIDDQAVFQKRCITVAALVVVYHDYFLTLSREVHWIWPSSRGLSLIPAIFYLNRYLALVGFPLLAHRTFATPIDRLRPDPVSIKAISSQSMRTLILNSQICDKINFLKNALPYVLHILAAVFSVVRTYGLYGRSRKVLIFLCIGLLSALAGALVLFFVSTGKETPLVFVDNCFHGVADDNAFRTALQYSFLLCFDLAIFILILCKSLQRSRRDTGTPLLTILIRDGTLFFGIMSLTCLAIILSFGYSSTASRGQGIVLGASFSSILVSRIILNIRDPSLRGRDTTTITSQFKSYLSTDIGALTTDIDTKQTDSEADMLDCYSDLDWAEESGHGHV
ncbi:hypothetical protein FA15DRAFT_758890 [Coprinopsis marcescibilis]|uniref:DUF6533 domain-containing protein n=1 Tax=Coprinopsis marcescibilis TaxID=230819 RepID=A0A5C3KMT0_COPMA|nr:hypothetical protein FA15DRAFT_758890 [Coprinopsis marcescibilis]